MAVTLIATPGAANANSYLTAVEAQAYMDTRITIREWDDADSQDVLLIMATRVLDALSQPYKTLCPPSGGSPAYYIVRPQWTGAPATTTQRLAWPRLGMFDYNGNAINPATIPQTLKDVTAELAAQLAQEDRTLDNSVITQGLTSIKAGSVALTFKQNIMPQVIPDAVYNMMPLSWLTDELYLLANEAIFDVITGPTGIF